MAEFPVVQVNLCQKHLFLQQLTHNMTKDCTLNYSSVHENYNIRMCYVHKLFFVFVLTIQNNLPYARHHNPRLVYFFTPFPKTIYVL